MKLNANGKFDFGQLPFGQEEIEQVALNIKAFRAELYAIFDGDKEAAKQCCNFVHWMEMAVCDLNSEEDWPDEDETTYTITPHYLRIICDNGETHTIKLATQQLLNDDMRDCTFEIPVCDKAEYVALDHDFKSLGDVKPVFLGVNGEASIKPNGDGLRLHIDADGRIRNIDFAGLNRSIVLQIGGV